MNSIWIIIWRFQPLHNGHNLLIEAALKENISTTIFIGSANITNIQNPYSFELRKEIISRNFTNEPLYIESLPDFETDEPWIQHILSHLPKNLQRVILYCGDKQADSAIKSITKLQDILPFKVKIVEIPRSIIPVSATQIRSALENNNSDFLSTYLSKITRNILKNQS